MDEVEWDIVRRHRNGESASGGERRLGQVEKSQAWTNLRRVALAAPADCAARASQGTAWTPRRLG
jgi:hypothetical protein